MLAIFIMHLSSWDSTKIFFSLESFAFMERNSLVFYVYDLVWEEVVSGADNDFQSKKYMFVI